MKSKASNKAPCLCIFGTGSDVGKSIVTTAICRFFYKKNIKVAPFKAQNMSNNSGVTPEGLEMGRAQIVQAEAAGIPPHVDMNPILLKPTSDVGSQVVLMGKAFANSTASEYHKKKNALFKSACEALDRLRDLYDLVVIEGAGSCAEVNLMEHDIVNFRLAEYAGAKVILVGDIHRGGIFAQLIGTMQCISKKQKDMIAGFIINRFRGDISLFHDGIEWIERKTGKKIFGVLPCYTHINIESEDSVVIENPKTVTVQDFSASALAVLRIPHISNFTDFDPLLKIPEIDLHFLEKPQSLLQFKGVIIPGSKSTRSDLAWLKGSGWINYMEEYVKQGGHILGICGGYQMLGEFIHDPQGLEGTPGSTRGLALLPVETVLKAPKTTTLTRFLHFKTECSGYEIHMGQTTRKAGNRFFKIISRNQEPCMDDDGCITDDSRIIGTYIHGLFDNPGVTKFWLKLLGIDQVETGEAHGLQARSMEYDLLADHFEKYVNMDAINRVIIQPISATTDII